MNMDRHTSLLFIFGYDLERGEEERTCVIQDKGTIRWPLDRPTLCRETCSLVSDLERRGEENGRDREERRGEGREERTGGEGRGQRGEEKDTGRPLALSPPSPQERGQ